jgi:hypothetical protein
MTGVCGAGGAGGCTRVAGAAGADWMSAKGFVVTEKLPDSGVVRMMAPSVGASGGSEVGLGAFAVEFGFATML